MTPLRVSGKSSDSNDQAGFWGSLDAKCDIPLYTFENALQYVAEEIKVYFIIFISILKLSYY